MSIAENIKRLREEYGITQEELAKIADVTDKAVSKWELGKSEPRMGAVCKISAYFGINRLKITNDFDTEYAQPTDDRREDDLLTIYRMLNNAGKEEVMKYMKYIVSNNEYREG